MATNKELQAIIDEQNIRIAELQARITELESKPKGGKGSGKKWTEEQKANLKAVMAEKAHQWTPEEKARMSETMKQSAHKWSDEEKAQMSATMKSAFAIIKDMRKS